MARSGVKSTHPHAEEAARDVLSSGGGALSAALSGFFAAAGSDAGVLLSPLSLVVGGLGTGVFAYDGRLRQPGRGAKRPRGFLEDQEVPLAAHAAVPTGIAALAVACAFHPGTTLIAASKAGISVAKANGKKGRADVIDRIAGLGARFLLEPGLRKELLARLGPVEQGSLTQEDLQVGGDLQMAAVSLSDEQRRGQLAPPWCQPARDVPQAAGAGRGHALVAIDARGLSVALTFRSLPNTIYLDPFEIAFPALGVPVRRGVPRVTPGAILPTMGTVSLESPPGEPPCAAYACPDPGQSELVIRRDHESKEVFVLA